MEHKFMMEHEMQSELDREWSDQSHLIEPILNRGGVSAYLSGLPDTTNMFRLADQTVRCMDEGTAGGGLHLAGSGILLGEERAAELLRAAGVDRITSHEGCGAASLFAKERGLDPAMADRFGQEFAQKLAARLGVPHQHIAAQEMSRPKEFHHARIAIYDGTGRFNPDTITDLPAAFIINRRINPDAGTEALISANIAMGHHGFGTRFTPDTPFTIVVIGDPNDRRYSADHLIQELEPIAETWGNRVRVECFTPSADSLKPRET